MDKKLKKTNISKKFKEKNKEGPTGRKKFLLVGLVMLIFLTAGAGIFLLLKTRNAAPDISMGMGEAWSGSMISASGVTAMGMVSDDFEVEKLDTELYIEEVYVSAGSEVEAGTPILKISEESILEARKELEAAVREATLNYRAGVLEYEQSRITAKYDYDMAVLKGEQAKEVYESTLAQLAQKADAASEALEEANTLIAEYTSAQENNTYAEEYPYERLQALYDENLQLLKDRMEEWGIGWSQVTGGRGGNEYETVLVSLYAVLEQNLKDYEEARENYDNAVADAELQLQKLNLQLSGLKAEAEKAQKEKEEQEISARLVYETALAQKEQAEGDYETALQKARAVFEELETAKEEAEKNLALFEESIGDGFYYASQKGTVLVANCRAGNYLQPESMVAAYSSQEEVTITAAVDQADIAALNVGDSASVTISGYGSYQGTITEINPVSSSDSRTSVAYNVTVLLNGDVSSLSANLTATVIFGMGGTADD